MALEAHSTTSRMASTAFIADSGEAKLAEEKSSRVKACLSIVDYPARLERRTMKNYDGISLARLIGAIDLLGCLANTPALIFRAQQGDFTTLVCFPFLLSVCRGDCTFE